MERVTPPSSAETICATEYRRSVRKPSRYVRGLTVDAPDEFICPRCRSTLGQMEHGDIRVCRCKLSVALYGNGLTIWEEQVS